MFCLDSSFMVFVQTLEAIMTIERAGRTFWTHGTEWCFEKLIVLKLTCFLEPKDYYYLHNFLPLVSILSQMNLVQTFLFAFCKIHFNIILPCLALPSCFFPSGFTRWYSYMNMKTEVAIMPLNAILLLSILISYLHLCSESYSSATVSMW